MKRRVSVVMFNDRANYFSLLLGEGEGWGGGGEISRLLARVCVPLSRPSPASQGKESLRFFCAIGVLTDKTLPAF